MFGKEYNEKSSCGGTCPFSALLSFYQTRLKEPFSFKSILVFVLTALLLTGLMFQMSKTPAQAAARNSRLSQLIKQKPSLYKPTRFFVGEDNKVVVKAPAGNTVVLVMSPMPGETKAPNGDVLRVSTSHETLEQTATEKGVAVFTIPVPDDKRLKGQWVFIDGYTYKQPDFSDLQVFNLIDATGRPASHNRLAIQTRTSGEGTMLMPGIPGMDASMLRRLSTFGEVANDERKQDLVDDGSIDRDSQIDQNSFIVRPDGTGGVGNSGGF